MDAVKPLDAGLVVSDVCPELGINSTTFCKWRAKYMSIDASMMVHMKALEAGNARLKKMYIRGKLKAEIFNEAISQT
jgi:putative transposase